MSFCPKINASMMRICLLIFATAAFASAASDEPIGIVSQQYEIEPDGTYHQSYETANGIQAAESGSVQNPGKDNQAEVVHGSYRYTADDGSPISLSYVADENGFQPEGSHLPAAPPVPPLIQRSLAYIEAHPPPPEKP